jgi:hypothetical protein
MGMTSIHKNIFNNAVHYHTSVTSDIIIDGKDPRPVSELTSESGNGDKTGSG